LLEQLSVGDVFSDFYVVLDSKDVNSYLMATGENNSLWQTYVPPLAVGARILAEIIDDFGDLDGLMHTGQEFSFLSKILHSQKLNVRVEIGTFSKRKGNLIIAFSIEIYSESNMVGSGKTNVIIFDTEGNSNV